MRLRGGHNILLHGRPSGTIEVLPEPRTLYLPLWSRRFQFDELGVEEGQRVSAGHVLARDPGNYGVPLLAPRAGTVRLGTAENHVVLEDVAKEEAPAVVDVDLQHVPAQLRDVRSKLDKAMTMGAWQFLYEAHTGALPDPAETPQALIVSITCLEPFVARGDAQLHAHLLNFTRGLEHLQSLLEYQPIYLVLPDIRSEFADFIRDHIRGYAWVKMVEIPLIYPYDDFAILARGLDLKKSGGPVWAMRTEGVLALDCALTLSKPCVERVLSVGGTRVVSPTHVQVVPGYPIRAILDKYVFEHTPRIIDGGIMTGEAIAKDALGISTECRGITVLSEPKGREFLGFMRPGSDRHSYSACFLSSLLRAFGERLTTAQRGEGRPCISCNFCEEVCPAGLIPHLLHKYMYQDLLDEVGRCGVDLCVACGLCSYVCPSKIDLRAQYQEARTLIEEDRKEMRGDQTQPEPAKEVVA